MILKNCRLVPELCEGFQEEMADIRIEGDLIAEILPAGGSYIGEEVIDCTGKTALPGLFDLHSHIYFNTMFPGPQSFYEHTRNHYSFMYKYLAQGYTSLRDVGSSHNLAIKIRNDINAGRIIGPDLKTSGMILTPNTPPQSWELLSPQFGFPVDNPYEVRAMVRKQVAEGADFIKILACTPSPTPRGGGSLFYPDELEALNEAVHREGVYLAVHTNGVESNEVAIDLEPRTIEHGHFWNQDLTDRWDARGRKSYIVPTLAITWNGWGKEACEMHTAGLRNAYDAGALFGWGTDNTEEMFAANTAGEFQARSAIWGISNIEILKMATINSAIINGTDAERGSIKVGKKADFAIIEGKPDQDFNLFGKPCDYVLKDGVVVAQHGYVKAI